MDIERQEGRFFIHPGILQLHLLEDVDSVISSSVTQLLQFQQFFRTWYYCFILLLIRNTEINTIQIQANHGYSGYVSLLSLDLYGVDFGKQ